jgi:hypothetical protein
MDRGGRARTSSALIALDSCSRRDIAALSCSISCSASCDLRPRVHVVAGWLGMLACQALETRKQNDGR